jgi:hypothetical protein
MVTSVYTNSENAIANAANTDGALRAGEKVFKRKL